MMHSVAVTATRVVWLDLPVVFDLNLIGGEFHARRFVALAGTMTR